MRLRTGDATIPFASYFKAINNVKLSQENIVDDDWLDGFLGEFHASHVKPVIPRTGRGLRENTDEWA